MAKYIRLNFNVDYLSTNAILNLKKQYVEFIITLMLSLQEHKLRKPKDQRNLVADHVDP